MKIIIKYTTAQLIGKTIACLLAFLNINGPVRAISSSDVITSTNAGVTTSGNTTTVDVLGNRSVIDWSDFNTSGFERLEFQRSGGANFAVLNRLLSGSQTKFNGTLNGNQGDNIVIHQNGIVFGPTAEVTARRFTASTLPLDISDTEFLGGGNNYAFKTGSAKGKIELAAGAEITAEQVELLAHQISNSGTIVGTNGLVVLAAGDEIYLASESEDIVVKVAAPNISSFTYSITNQASGRIQNHSGKVVLAAGDTFAQALTDIHTQTYAVGDYNIEQRGAINAAEVEAGAAQQIALRSSGSTEADTINLAAQKIDIRQNLNPAGNLTADSDYYISANVNLNSGGDMSLVAHQTTVFLEGQVVSQGKMDIEACTNLTLMQGAESRDTMNLTAGNQITSFSDLSSQTNMTLAADTSLTAADIIAADDLTINSNVSLFGLCDQTIESSNGRVTAEGYIHKTEPGQLFITGNDPELSVDLKYAGPEWGVSNLGNIYVSGQGDIQLSGGLTGMGNGLWQSSSEGELACEMGGVSVISQNGRIFTEASNVLDVTLQGFSDDVSHDFWYYSWKTGVDLPFKDSQGQALGKAAIVLQSKKDLILGADAAIDAFGVYLPSSENWGSVIGPDDRPGVNFLAENFVIGGFDRQQGASIDAAVYAGSVGGNVIIKTDNISVQEFGTDGGYSSVVVDAYDTVSMPFLGLLSEDSNFGGFRLEVASRLCEWLPDAVNGNKLPFASDPAFVEAILGNDYVLRGAGQNNSTIGRGERAWVLEEPPAEPIVPPLPFLEIPEMKGCPVEMQAAAVELGIPAETLQMSLRSALAMNPNIQPCQACASLITAATILNDADGARLAAMNRIFNTLAPADAPFTPEVSASVVTAFVQLGDQDKQYALAAEYVDAFVRYVAILDTELKAPVGDPVAFALEKHGSALSGEHVNPNITAYIISQLMPEGI